MRWESFLCAGDFLLGKEAHVSLLCPCNLLFMTTSTEHESTQDPSAAVRNSAKNS